ncbi:helix-turn-helix domain-containing protein [Methyloligella sp. 2.7D]|uniref:winged helix-turn-helix transcriptional regulator n=1 Tax=unclassified Methyloligella TaxID=2625955 RepID=UPI00157BF020|nr:helix-turn-helix domain-containing protein [Methyloligella sp. GL2]QKP76312.1 helix-turn-helix transcriptional regulator [Methyloligella sp. GL2]
MEAEKKPKPSVFDADCSARDALELIASKWAILILGALGEQPMRNGAMLRKIGGISQKMLTQTLRQLECNGLVLREDHGTVPPQVVYRLTPLGGTLNEALAGLDRWAEANFPALDAAREKYLAAQCESTRR